MKIICASLLLLGGLFASAIAAAQACPGKLIAVENIYSTSSKKIGELQLYWDAGSKKNCARTMHAGSTWGQAHWTDVFLYTCQQKHFRNGRCNDGAAPKEDHGFFKYQAGPVSKYGEDRCVSAFGGIDPTNNNPGRSLRVATISGHCR